MQWHDGAKSGRIKIDLQYGKKITHKNFWKRTVIVRPPYACGIAIVSTIFYAFRIYLGEWIFKFNSALCCGVASVIFIYLAHCQTLTIIDFCGNTRYCISNYIGFICMASRRPLLTKKERQ
jgi:Ran GTPase-activating protein (RanGAP) involved in mRNA processing and transport